MIETSLSPDYYEGNVDTPYSMKSMMSTRSSKRQHAQATHTPAHWTPPYHNYTIVVASYSLLYVDFHFGDRRRANSTRPTFFPCRLGDSNPTAQKTPAETVGGSPSLPSVRVTTTTAPPYVSKRLSERTTVVRFHPFEMAHLCTVRPGPRLRAMHRNLRGIWKPIDKLDGPIGAHSISDAFSKGDVIFSV